MSQRAIRIEPSDPQSPEALFLLREAALEARHLYSEFIAPNTPMPTNSPLPSRGAYFVAFLDNKLVGCGALRPLDKLTAEVRRMYVLPSVRRTGVGRALLTHLERTASQMGFKIMCLETGNGQRAAMALYKSCGFVRIPPFGEHLNDPTSVCYEKPVCTG